MIAAIVVYGLITSCAFGFAALAIERLCHMRRRATRWIWVAAMIEPLLLPLIGAALSPSHMARASVSSGSHDAASPIVQVRELTSLVPSLDLTRPAQHLAGNVDLDRILLFAWSGASALLLLTIAANCWRLRRRAMRTARIAGIEVSLSNTMGPALFGVIRPRIIVPTWFADLDPDTQRTALVHELKHREAHDSRLLAGALVLLVLTPWNLPMWWQWRRLRLAIEVDCDARVLRSGERAAAYGAALLRVAEHRSAIPLFAPAMNQSATALEQRIRLLFDPIRPSSKAIAAAFLTCAASCTIAVAQVNPLSAPAVRVAATSSPVASPASRALARGLIEVIQSGDYDAAASLLDLGADVNARVLGDGTPLIVAARLGDQRMVQLLIERGADANLPCSGDGNPLIMAAMNGSLGITRILIERGADVNGIVMGDETPLINAARRGQLDVVKYLVERGADVSLAVPAGSFPQAEVRSPLSEARKYRRTAVVDYLQSLGAR